MAAPWVGVARKRHPGITVASFELSTTKQPSAPASKSKIVYGGNVLLATIDLVADEDLRRERERKRERERESG